MRTVRGWPWPGTQAQRGIPAPQSPGRPKPEPGPGPPRVGFRLPLARARTGPGPRTPRCLLARPPAHSPRSSMAGPRAPEAGSASRSLPVPGPLVTAAQLFRRELRPGTERAAAARARARRASRPQPPPRARALRPRSPPRGCWTRPVSTLDPPPPPAHESARSLDGGRFWARRQRRLVAEQAGGTLPGLQALCQSFSV